MLFTRNTNSRKALLERIDVLETRLRAATDFLSKIAQGDHSISQFEIHKGDLDEESKQFLEKLTRTRDMLSEYTQRDRERVWVAEGMAKFMDVIQGDRNHSQFYDKVVTMIVRYAGAIQGGLFMLNDEDPDDIHLELKACYAYDRKKFLEKKIGIGNGMLGQCFLEKETSLFTTVPDSYFNITSGLGEATPRFLAIIPLKYDTHVMGVLEIASFEKLPSYKIEFIERMCENLASVALNIRQNLKATKLYEESQAKAKRLQEQEEVLNQNIEELEATQEEMKRHQRELDQRSYLMKVIIDNIPFPIFVKDEKGRYTLVNKSEAKLFDLSESQLIGKDDSHFVASSEEWKVIQESDEKVLDSDDPLELPIQHFTTANGNSYVFKTTKIPFFNTSTGKKNILGVSIDLTEKLRLEKKLLQERSINATNTVINLVGRQRMLSQKIGFYAEVVAKGKTVYTDVLKSAVDLFEHSMDVIKYGGTPIGIKCEQPLANVDDSLLPYLKSIEDKWLPYKDAVKKIIYYVTFKDTVTASVKDQEIEIALNYIETHAEVLLLLNNDLMLACIQLHQDKRQTVEID